MKTRTLWGIAAALLFVAVASFIGVNIARSREASQQNGEAPVPEAFRKNPRAVLIVEYSGSSHSASYIEGAKSEAASLGLSLEVRDARNDRKEMANMLDSAVLQRVDGIMISHGDSEQLRKGAERAVQKGIPIVSFDNEIALNEVTKLDQNDHKMAEIVLTRLIADTQGKANLVLIWVPGYAPMEKRMETYTRMMAATPGMREAFRFGKVTNNTALQTEVAMAEVLKKHPKGTIDAVWATWDEFAKGAVHAIRKAGRTEIKVYGIDASNEDLDMIQDPESPWVATVGCPATAIGHVQVRLLGYRIAGRPVPPSYSLEPVLVAREMLPTNEKVSLETLHRFVPAWADTHDFTDPWIVALKAKNKK